MSKRAILFTALAAMSISACQQDPYAKIAKTAEEQCLRSNGAPNWKPSDGQTFAQFCADWGNYEEWRYIAAHDPKRFEKARADLKRTLDELDRKRGDRPR